ncbi:hypothetical protein [Clostridium merdae]|uniref:hypothetical protein n=1 Tax=Clostridium merdae TaxID=1958780 RepID=UPI000A267363|nr:hypothetical protein [Clostridium merdae]
MSETKDSFIESIVALQKLIINLTKSAASPEEVLALASLTASTASYRESLRYKSLDRLSVNKESKITIDQKAVGKATRDTQQACSAK